MLVSGARAAAAGEPSHEMRQQMADRALNYLFAVQKQGVLGESRQGAVTSLFLLACLSSGVRPSHPTHGPNLRAAYQWIVKNTSTSFLGGREEPNAGHAIAALALTELIGTAPARHENLALYQKARRALDHSLTIQDRGGSARYAGGWRPSDKTRVNSRVLTAWFLLQLRSATLRGMEVPRRNVSSAIEFVAASQRVRSNEAKDDLGGFSVDAEGLPVRSATAAGMAALALFDPDEKRLKLARDWLSRHRPRWYGPHFFESNFFAVRALHRSRDLDDGRAFRKYFDRLVRILKERQEPDGSFPFPPGHGGPLVAMGKAYSTAMAVLILNVDRGILPVDG